MVVSPKTMGVSESVAHCARTRARLQLRDRHFIGRPAGRLAGRSKSMQDIRLGGRTATKEAGNG
jgi:hypothetical protein